MAGHPDEVALIQRIAQADASALGLFYDMYNRLVFSIAYQVLNQEQLAEEVTQDVFLQIWNKAATYDAQQGKVLTWLTTIARHRAIDQFRRLRVRPEGHAIAWEDCCLDNPDDQLEIEPRVMNTEQSRQIQNAMSTLPSEQRQALALAYYTGMTQQQISEYLNEPLGTIKTRIRLGLQKLRSSLISNV
jgi:RNA polymerase sigma-70 factor (ECF subfamily)